MAKNQITDRELLHIFNEKTFYQRHTDTEAPEAPGLYFWYVCPQLQEINNGTELLRYVETLTSYPQNLVMPMRSEFLREVSTKNPVHLEADIRGPKFEFKFEPRLKSEPTDIQPEPSKKSKRAARTKRQSRLEPAQIQEKMSAVRAEQKRIERAERQAVNSIEFDPEMVKDEEFLNQFSMYLPNLYSYMMPIRTGISKNLRSRLKNYGDSEPYIEKVLRTIQTDRNKLRIGDCLIRTLYIDDDGRNRISEKLRNVAKRNSTDKICEETIKEQTQEYIEQLFAWYERWLLCWTLPIANIDRR
jgi:hypothetical protein